jgi:hypothetical protein
MASQQVSQQQCNNSSAYSDIIPFTNNQQLNKSPEEADTKALPQSSNLNKSHQFPSKEIRFNKLNMNSSFNVPSPNTATNISLNEQVLHQKKEPDDCFDNDVSYQDEDENDPILKEYTMINNRRNQTIDEIKNINERIKNNKLKIEEIKQNIVDLKEEKKQKQGDIVNLLSNKESIEEIYKNQIYLLINHINGTSVNSNNFNDNNNTLNNDINNLINISIKNEMNDNSIINLNSMHNITICDNEISNTDEDSFKITISEIKNSDQKKYVEQVINMFEDIFKKKDDKINSSITSIINNSYELFINGTENENETNSDLVVNNFFGKLSLFISNHSLGKYSEAKINLFLRYLIKINAINVKLTKYIKFVNKKYKEKKKELNDMISFLEKKNINLADKRHRLENNIKEYDERLEFFGKNDVFEIEQNYEGEELLDNNDSNEDNKNSSSKKKKIRNKNMGTLNTHDNIRKEIENLEKLNNEEQLSHDVVIEYEDGIDQNAEINYEEDDLTDEYDYDKENEMINQGLNPYNKNINTKKKSLIHKQRNKKMDNKQIIVNDNDESDKYLNELLRSDTNSGENKKINKRNSKNIIKNINNVGQSPNIQIKTNASFQMGKKINYSNNYNFYNTSVVTDNRVYPTPQNLNKTGDNELDNKLSSIELEHYNRVQKIMSAGPNISNIFGVNNYNPETDPNRDIMFSPKKNVSNVPGSSNKIDKTIRYGSRKNHNFISIINMTKNVPIKKKNGKDKTKTKEKTKKNKGADNEGTIKVINLEENFLNELSNDNDNDGIKNDAETENKMGNESTSVLTKSNNLETYTNNKSINMSHGSRNNDNNKSNNLIINENSENENNNIVPQKSRNNNTKDNNEVQGYFLKIINSKQPNKDKKNSNQTQEKNDTKDIFNNNSNIKTLKITNCREINVNDSKTNNKFIIKKNIPKTMVTKKYDKPKSRINHIKRDTKENLSLNNTELRSKQYTSLNKNNTQTKLITHHVLSANKSINNNYVNVNESSGNRANSFKQHQPEENNRNIRRNNQYNTTQKINNNNLKSPNNNKRGKYGNIPISKMKLSNNRSYNSSTFESNFKSGLKVENSNIKSTNRK